MSVLKKEINREEVQEWVQERFDLSVERIRTIADENAAKAPFTDYFNQLAAFILYVERAYKMRQDGRFAQLTAEELEKMNHCFYADILPKAELWEDECGYGKSYANPRWAV